LTLFRFFRVSFKTAAPQQGRFFCVIVLFMNTKSFHILAIHGAGMNGAVFGGITPHLLPHHITALNLPGHDKSQTVLTSISAMAAYVRAAIENIPQGQPLALMGHSMGGLVALAAADHPRVEKIIVLSAAQTMPVNADLLALAKSQPAEAWGKMVKWSIFKDHPQAEAMRTAAASIFARVPQECLAPDLAACDVARAEPATKPALFIVGQDDKMVKAAEVESFAAQCAKGKFLALPACGHMPTLEQPIVTATAIKDFLG
jgi:pimeloyl-ACP methyl ester carboxylesterase